MTAPTPPGPAGEGTPWLQDASHRSWLRHEAGRQFAFFRASLNPAGGFHTLDLDGSALPDPLQELHSTTRLIHSYAMAQKLGLPGAAEMVDHGMRYLWSHHRDTDHGGYLWGIRGNAPADSRKLAYGHVFVLLAGASAQEAGHPDAPRLIADATAVLDRHFWEDGPGLFCDEWNRDWTPFSTYRGMNANMHGVEALLAAHEATGAEPYLARAGRILDMFTRRMASLTDWRIPEHYTADWQVDRGYSGNPMFRPAGTTPGHSFEFARLLLQHWDLAGRPADDAPDRARHLIDRALADAWLPGGGLAYTLDFDGQVAIPARYWWPVTEAIGAIAMLLKLDPRPQDEVWYRRLWQFADDRLIDHARGGWFPELGPDDGPAMTQFRGKPDIYHSVQAALLPLTPGLSRHMTGLATL